MPVYNPRNRLVNFRLSEDEYQLLKSSCIRSGARSVSDFARAAVLSSGNLSAVAESPVNCASRWERLEGCVHDLELKLGQLIEKESVVAHG